MSESGAATVYDAEVRFGVVMYGGVSLAIYIYGVSRELFELACATPLDGRPLSLPDPEGTRAVYARLSRLASDPDLLAQYAQALRTRDGGGRGAAVTEVQGPPHATPPADVWQSAWDDGERTRFVIDVIAGTSAGGINGIYLAKALALAQPFSVLNDLWVNEGDLGKLLNDDHAADDLVGGLPQADGTRSLLSSDRMYRKLLQALDDMQAAGAASVSPLVEELDLFVTTTDIAGAPVSLRLHDKVVTERRHKQRFHFSYPSRFGVGRDRFGQDFAEPNHAFLAYAARCTSSFPFAFEPMQLSRVPLLSPATPASALAQWKPYFDAYEPQVLVRGDWDQRPFGDGGYLDNKPFSYVVEALSQRFGQAPAQRKLLYIEPDPERLDPVRSADTPVPNALQNALGALSAIPLYETIREDLMALLQRNGRIERVERLLRLAEEDVEDRDEQLRQHRPDLQPFDRVLCEPPQPGAPGEVPVWSDLPLSAMVRYYGHGFKPYRRLRVYAVTDTLAAQLATAFGIEPQSDQGYALRAVVRAWREHRYDDELKDGKESVNAFLDRFDLDYRLRRGAFLLRRVDQITRMLLAQRRKEPPAPSELEAMIARKMARLGIGDPARLRAQGQLAGTLQALRVLRAALHENHRQVMDAHRQRSRGQAVPATLRDDAELRDELTQVLVRLIGGDRELPDLRLRTVDGGWLTMPRLDDQPDSRLAADRLQDSVMARVKSWLAQSLQAGRPVLLLWKSLYLALDGLALKVEVPKPVAGKPVVAPPAAPTQPPPAVSAVQRLLDAQWALLGAPELKAVKRAAPVSIDGVVRAWRAELRVNPVGTGDGLQPLAVPAQQHQANRLRQLLAEYYLSFDEYDQTRFTMYYDTGTGEPAMVDVLRVSPDDATSLRPDPKRRTLAGTTLAHFGAFLDEDWRRNDILWGRLDGAERLLHTVLPGGDDDTRRVRDELLRLAQGAILRHTLQSRQAGELTRRLLSGLQQPLADIDAATAGTRWAARDRRDQLGSLMTAVGLPGQPAQQALVQSLAAQMLPHLLHALLDPSGLRHCVAWQPTFNPDPPPAPLLRHAARAVTITGRVLDGLSQDGQVAGRPLGRWVVRLGQALQAATALALPGVGMPIVRRLLLVLYSVEGLLALGSLLFADAGLRALAISMLVGTGGAHLVLLALTDALRRGKVAGAGWAAGVAALLTGVLLLAVAGGMALWLHGWRVLRAPDCPAGGASCSTALAHPAAAAAPVAGPVAAPVATAPPSTLSPAATAALPAASR